MNNKGFYFVGVVLLVLALGITFVMSGGVEPEDPMMSPAPAENGLRINP